MKRFSVLLAAFLCISVFGQKANVDDALNKIVEEACSCIGEIDLYDRPRDEIVKDVSDCIDKQVIGYQLISKLTSIDLTGDGSGEKQDVNIEIGTQKGSPEYSKAYKEIERRLLESCEDIEYAINNHDKLNDNSVSEDPEARRYYNVGMEEAKDGNCERAIEYYKEAVRIDENFAFAWDNMGICYRRLAQYDKAIEAYEKSLSVSPGGKMPLQNLAIVYEYRKEYQKAVDAYKKMGEYFPDDPEVLYGLGHIYTNYMNDDETALDYACKAYLKYIEIRSPYRADAEDMILILYNRMKKDGKEDVFLKVLKKYDIGFED